MTLLEYFGLYLAAFCVSFVVGVLLGTAAAAVLLWHASKEET